MTPIPKDINVYIATVARRLSLRLVRIDLWPANEMEDLQQELHLGVWLRYRCFNKRRASLNTFIYRVATNIALNLLASRRAACRDYRNSVYSEDVQCPSRCINPYRRENRVVSRLDVWKVVHALPPKLRQTATELMEYSPTEIARMRGTSRETVYASIRELRKKFLDASCGRIGHDKISDTFRGDPVYRFNSLFQAGTSQGVPDVKGAHDGASRS